MLTHVAWHVSPSQSRSIRRKKLVMRQIQLLPSIIALFVRIELSCSSISRLPPNRADGEAVIEVALFGTTARPSSTAQKLYSYEQSHHAEK